MKKSKKKERNVIEKSYENRDSIAFAIVASVLEVSIIDRADRERIDRRVNLLMKPYVIQCVIAAPLQAVNVRIFTVLIQI